MISRRLVTPLGLLFVLFSWALGGLTERAFGQSFVPGEFFFDSFDDGDHQDSNPVHWKRGAFPGGDDRVIDGDLYILGVNGPPSSVAPSDGGGPYWSYEEDLSITTQVRIFPSGGVASAGMFGRSLDSRVYFGAIDNNGMMLIGKTDNSGATIERQSHSSGLNPEAKDVLLKMDFDGDLMSLSAWTEGDAMPGTPQLTFQDDELASGTIALDAFGQGDVAFRWVDVTPVPEAEGLLLASIGFIALVGVSQPARRRKKLTMNHRRQLSRTVAKHNRTLTPKEQGRVFDEKARTSTNSGSDFVFTRSDGSRTTRHVYRSVFRSSTISVAGTFVFSCVCSCVFLVNAGSAADFDRMLVFGDSLSDTGNVFHLTNGAQGGPPNYDGRWSDGLVWVEQLAARLEVDDAPTPSLLGGTNYAFGWARTGYGTHMNEHGTEIPRLGEQIDSYLAREQQIAPNDLVVVWIGHNDRGNTADRTIHSNISEHLATLRAHGAQHVLIPNIIVPPAVVYPDQQSAADSVMNFNRALDAYLGQVAWRHSLDIYRVDMTPVWNELFLSGDLVLNAAYDVASGIVQADPERFIWWDNGGWHPSSTTHEVLAEAAYALLLEGPTEFPFGDVDGDLSTTVDDIDGICRGTVRRHNPLYDLDDDGRVSVEDVAVFLAENGTQPGDANLDGATDFADFVTLSTHFGQSGPWSSGDFDCSGTVEFTDFVILAENFGESGADEFATVPEPSAFTLVLWLLAGVPRQCRGR